METVERSVAQVFCVFCMLVLSCLVMCMFVCGLY